MFKEFNRIGILLLIILVQIAYSDQSQNHDSNNNYRIINQDVNVLNVNTWRPTFGHNRRILNDDDEDDGDDDDDGCADGNTCKEGEGNCYKDKDCKNNLLCGGKEHCNGLYKLIASGCCYKETPSPTPYPSPGPTPPTPFPTKSPTHLVPTLFPTPLPTPPTPFPTPSPTTSPTPMPTWFWTTVNTPFVEIHCDSTETRESDSEPRPALNSEVKSAPVTSTRCKVEPRNFVYNVEYKVILSINNTREGMFFPVPNAGQVLKETETILFTSRQAQEIRVSGIYDGVLDNDEAFSISSQLSVLSDGTIVPSPLQSLWTFINVDVTFPVITRIDPYLVPLQGQLITIEGKNFAPGIVVYIGIVPANIVSHNDSNKLVIDLPSVDTVYALLGRWFNETYQNLTLITPNSGWAQCPNNKRCEVIEKIYYSDSCQKNWYGTPPTCWSCLQMQGSSCPGGYRLRPLQGFYKINEFPYELPLKCNQPPNRCLGGVGSPCGPGYMGVLCGECLPHYYLDGLRCLPCKAEKSIGNVAESVFLVIYASLFFILVGVCIVLTEDRFLNNAIRILVTAQHTVAAGYAVSSSMPVWMADLYYWIKIVAFDWTIIRPECDFGKVPYPIYYLWTLLFLFGAMLVSLLCAIVYQYHKHRDTTWSAMTMASRWIYSSKYPRIKRSLIVTVYITYLEVCRRTLWVLYCSRIQGELLLIIEPSIRCYHDGSHILASIFAWPMLFLYCLGMPIFLLSRLMKYAHPDPEKLYEKVVQRNYGFLYAGTKPNCYWFRSLNFLINFILVAMGVFTTDLRTQFPVFLAVFSGLVFLVVRFWPMKTRPLNQAQLIMGNLKIVILTTMILIHENASVLEIICGIIGIAVVIFSCISYFINPPKRNFKNITEIINPKVTPDFNPSGKDAAHMQMINLTQSASEYNR